MQLKKAMAIVSGLGVVTATQAGALSSATGDIAFSGGATAGYFYNDKTGSKTMDGLEVPDISLNFSSDAKVRGVGFNVVTGRSMLPSLMNSTPTSIVTGGAMTSSPDGFNIFVADFTIAPIDNLTLDIGKLPTTIGYEIAPTFANPNVVLGAVWFSQPITYPGVRASYKIGPATVFVETNKDTSTGGSGANVYGATAAISAVNLSASYYDAYNGRNIVDLIASATLGNITVAANIDYHMQDSAVQAPGMATKALGAAFYVVPKMGKMSLPVRLEYLSDKTSGIYGGMDSGYTATITPTYNLSENAAIRIEGAYVKSKNKIFKGSDGVTLNDNKMVASVSASVKF